MALAEWFMLLALSVLWGGSFFFNGVILRELPPFTAVAGRLAIAAVLLFAMLRVARVAPPSGARTWAALFVMGLLNNAVPFCLVFWGQTQIASGLAAILNAVTPVSTVLVAHVLTPDEKLTDPKIAGVLLGLAGVAVVVGPEALRGVGTDVWAQLAVLAAGLCYAFAGIHGRRFKAMLLDPRATAAGSVAAAAVLLIPVALLVDHPWELAAPSAPTWAALMGLAGFSTALAYVLFFRILASAGATNVMLVTLLVPVSAVLLGVAFLGERLEPQHLAGMALIGAGLAAIDGRALRLIG
jgi:drug/metabolite transporter (DMT)-like permease